MDTLDSSNTDCRDRAARFLDACLADCGVWIADSWPSTGFEPVGNPRTCSCGCAVDASGTHAFVCKHAAARTVRHDSLFRDTITLAMSSAHISLRDYKGYDCSDDVNIFDTENT